MCLLEDAWQFTSSKGFSSQLVRQVRRELFSCLSSLPFQHTFFGASVSSITTASDASDTGGAIDYVEAASGELKPKRIPVLLLSLFNGIGGAVRCYDLL